LLNRTTSRVIVCLVALLIPTRSGAQSPATTFADLQRVLQAGQEVLVTEADGRRTRNIVVAVTRSELVVRSKSVWSFNGLGPQRTLMEWSVARVRRVDSLWQGALIGYATGFGLGVAACNAHPSDCVPMYVVVGDTLIGGAVGATIDALIRKTVFLKSAPRPFGRATITLSPSFGTKTSGASLTLQF
jgi:hypothetical protein